MDFEPEDHPTVEDLAASDTVFFYILQFGQLKGLGFANRDAMHAVATHHQSSSRKVFMVEMSFSIH